MKKTIISSIMILASVGLSAQTDVGEFLQLGKADAGKLSQAYLEPYGEMLGKNLNAGWYNSATVHKIGGFDITFQASYSMVPSSKTSYNIKDLNLQTFELEDGSSEIAPNMSGEMSNSDLPVLTDKQYGLTSFTVPNGAGMDYMPCPMIQAAVGLPLKSEIVVRYMPELKYGDLGKVGLWGVALKHNIDHYIPGLSKVPFFNMTLMGGYTQLNGSVTLPENDYLENGELKIESGAFTTRLLIGANFPFIALYTGVGYGNTSSDFNINGTFGSETGNIIALNYKNSDVNFNAGMRIRLGIIALHGDYTVGEYSMITAGLGFSFR